MTYFNFVSKPSVCKGWHTVPLMTLYTIKLSNIQTSLGIVSLLTTLLDCNQRNWIDSLGSVTHNSMETFAVDDELSVGMASCCST